MSVKEVARRLQVGETKGIGGMVGLVAPHPGCGWQGEDGLGNWYAIQGHRWTEGRLALGTPKLGEGWARERWAAHRLSQMVLVKKRRYW